MARFVYDGIDGLEDMFEHIAELPNDVIEGMLDAQADVVVKAQRRTARTMLQGPYNQGAVAAAVKKRKPQVTADGGHQYITFGGTQHGNRVAEIAFINEFGKIGQPARQFIQTANEESADETTEAGQKVLDDWINKL